MKIFISFAVLILYAFVSSILKFFMLKLQIEAVSIFVFADILIPICLFFLIFIFVFEKDETE